MTRPTPTPGTAATSDLATAFSRLHHEHVARLLADLAAPPTDRARMYLFRGEGNTGKTATAYAMASASRRGRFSVDMVDEMLLANPLLRGHHMMVVVEEVGLDELCHDHTTFHHLMLIPGLIIVFIAISCDLDRIPPALASNLTVLDFGPVSGADAAVIARDHFPDAEEGELAELAAAVDARANLAGGHICAMCRGHRGHRRSVREIAHAIAAGARY